MKKVFTLFLILFVFAIHTSAQEKNLDSVIDGIQKKYEQINNFQAFFTQESEVKALDKGGPAEADEMLIIDPFLFLSIYSPKTWQP